MENNILEVKKFYKSYGNDSNYAVKDINISVKKGEIFGFLGHNGAGKSTTIKAIVGIHSISSGSITINGYDINKDPLKAKLMFGFVSDNHALYEKLSGRKYLTYIARLYNVDEKLINERIDSLSNDFNLLPFIDNKIKDYSHGMKQKLSIIASLIHEPPLWILDEPLTGLDPMSAITLKNKMREHAEKGNAVFFSSHIIEVVEKICDKIAIINHGNLMCTYTMKEIKDNNITLEELYLKYFNKKEDAENE